MRLDGYTEVTCFYVDEPGWLTLDFNGPTFISAFVFLSNNNVDYNVEFSSISGFIGRTWGEDFTINIVETYFKIYFDVGVNNNHIILTFSCGEPDTSGMNSTIFI